MRPQVGQIDLLARGCEDLIHRRIKAVCVQAADYLVCGLRSLLNAGNQDARHGSRKQTDQGRSHDERKKFEAIHSFLLCRICLREKLRQFLRFGPWRQQTDDNERRQRCNQGRVDERNAQGSPSGTSSGGRTFDIMKNTRQTTVPEMMDASPPAFVARFQVSAARSAGVIATP